MVFNLLSLKADVSVCRLFLKSIVFVKAQQVGWT